MHLRCRTQTKDLSTFAALSLKKKYKNCAFALHKYEILLLLFQPLCNKIALYCR